MAFFATSARLMLRPPPDTRSFGQRVLLRASAKRAGGDLLNLLDGVSRRCVRGARVRVDRLAAAGHAAPGQVLARVAPDHVALLPGHVEHLGRDALHIAERLGAEVADARVQAKPAIGQQHEQAIETGRARDKRADGHTGAAHLAALALAASGNACGPVELLRALVERLLDERARGVGLLTACVRRAELRLAFRRVDPADGDLIDAELPARPWPGPARRS